MPDRVLNTLLEDRAQWDLHPMRVVKTLEPELPPEEKKEGMVRIVEVDPGEMIIIKSALSVVGSTEHHVEKTFLESMGRA